MKILNQMTLVLYLFLAGTWLGAPAFASEDLARKNACLGCHAMSQKVVGPSFQDVALKYKGQTAAAGKLAESITKGGTGKWGPIAMPAQPQLSAADASTLATWILSR